MDLQTDDFDDFLLDTWGKLQELPPFWPWFQCKDLQFPGSCSGTRIALVVVSCHIPEFLFFSPARGDCKIFAMWDYHPNKVRSAECGELVACPVLRKKKHNWFWSSHPRVILPPYVQYTLIYLHLALFSAHSSFRLDLRSFWLFMLTWPRKRAFVSWWTGIYAFFPGIYAYFPGKYAHNFGFKMHKAQKCQKWCNYAHVAKKSSESRNLSNEHLFVLFRGYIYIYTV